MKHSDWAELCGLISAMWPHQPVPPETASAWFPLVADLDVDDVRQAIYELRLDPAQRFAPSPAELRDALTPGVGDAMDAIPEISRRLSQSTPRSRSGEWDAISDYIATLGSLRDLRWDPSNPTVRAQLRDWWNHHHRRQAREGRQALAARAADRPALEKAAG